MSLIFSDPRRYNSPLNLFDNFTTNFNQQLNSIFGTSFDSELRAPPIDVHETETAYKVKVTLPDVSTKDLKVDFDSTKNELVVKASTNSTTETKDEDEQKTLVSERFSGSFERRIVFPTHTKINDAEIKAKMGNGVLNLVLPKVKAEKAPNPKSITVEESSEEKK